MNAFVLIGIAQAAFLGGLLLVKKNKQTFDYILLVWLICNAVQLYFFYLNFVYKTPPQSILLTIGGVWPYFIAPWLYFYVVALVKPEPFVLWRYSHHFIPFLIMGGSMAYFHWVQNPEQLIVIKEGYVQMRGSFPWHMRWYAMIMAFFSFLYPTWSLYLLFRHRNNIENEFSYLERINLDWLKYWILLSMFGFWISFGIIHAAGFQLLEYINSFHTVAAILVINILVIGFYGLRQTTIFTSFSYISHEERQSAEKYKFSKLKDDDAELLIEKLDDYMRNEKPYLNSQLTIDDLADSLQTKKHQLSQVINEKKEQNFFNYVNAYRIKEFKSRINDPVSKHLSLLGVALDSGFNSKSTFNHIFKKSEGMTPSAYKKSLK